MSRPLCPVLYDLLCKQFGTVKIRNEGQAFNPKQVPGLRGTTRLEGGERGEQYSVNCPHCGDTKYRLYISYRYAEYPFLLKCWHHDCFAHNRSLKQQFYERVLRSRRPVDLPVRRAEAAVDTGPVEVPGNMLSLADLPHQHPAVDYIRSRNYNPAHLADRWGVAYCELAYEQRHFTLQGRLYIPVIMYERLVGWQGRYLANLPKGHPTPKYFSMPGNWRRNALYNYDVAKRYDDVVVTEGVSKVWRIGDQAIATFGKDISFPQKYKIMTQWRERGVVIMLLDPDAAILNARICAELHQVIRKGVVQVTLPAGMDPGDLATEAVWDFIFGAAREQGVRLSNQTRPPREKTYG